MGRRSRKRRGDGAQAMSRGYAGARERDARARAELEPLEPGERPRAITVAALVAAAIGLANLAVYLAGWEIDGERRGGFGLIVFELVMFGTAWGMWRSRYWAVLGFQALLGISIVIAGLGLLVASNWQAVVLCVGIIGTAAPLFWFLIRAMARIQLPRSPGAR